MSLSIQLQQSSTPALPVADSPLKSKNAVKAREKGVHTDKTSPKLNIYKQVRASPAARDHAILHPILLQISMDGNYSDPKSVGGILWNIIMEIISIPKPPQLPIPSGNTEPHTPVKEVKHSKLSGVLCYINHFLQGCQERMENSTVLTWLSQT